MTEKSYLWWKHIGKTLVDSGASRQSFGLHDLQENELQKHFQNPLLESVVVDGTIDEIKHVMKLVFDGRFKEKCVRKVYSPLDAPPLTDISSYLRTFVYPRAFAINTMRHGALLSVDLTASSQH